MSSIQERQQYKMILTVLLVAAITILAGEIKIVPFEDTTFRFALGSIVFLLSTLVLRIPILITGLLTAGFIVPVRAFLSTMTEDTTFLEQIIVHSPAAAFYIMYTVILALVRIEKLKKKPVQLVIAATIAEVLANCSEQIANFLLFHNGHLQLHDIALLTIVAVLRSLFAIGLYSLVSLSEQKRQTEQLLSIGSNLYTESLYVKKMMELIEVITQDSFKMHQYLRKTDPQKALDALMISQNIHEVKKDLERVYAGLHKIVVAEQSNFYYFDDLLYLVVEANTRYSKWQQKQITFTINTEQNFSTKEPFLLLSIINNIVANAIEAIEEQGTIKISTKHTPSDVQISIENNGPTINQNLLESIFDAGYTTKFNENGVASTGIGLNHVQTMCEKMGGSVHVTSHETTIFTITIPTYKLLR